MRFLMIGLWLVNLLCLPALGQDASPATFQLGRNGEITHWLMLGYIPLRVEPSTYAKVLNADLLAGGGGEAKVRPAAGEKVKIAGSAIVAAPVELTWRLARASRPIITSGWDIYSCCDRLYLFADEQGRPLSKAACYLYCQLVSPEDKELSFIMGQGDSCKLTLNGAAVLPCIGPREMGNYFAVPLRIKKGRNQLLLRLDSYSGYGGFTGHLADAHGAVPDSIRVELALRPGVAEARTEPPPPLIPWDKIIAEIPPVEPVERPEFLGAQIPRTMSLLESGPWTRRPVRIVFYGQSNEFHWVDLLIQRLKQRFPYTAILAENHAVGGWGVDRLVRSMKHDIARQQPDLVLFHAYNGTFDEWERLFQTLRKETCTEIIVRTGHLIGADAKEMDHVVSDETIMLRTLARKYDIELVDVRREWINYLKANKFKQTDLTDHTQVHMNRKGQVLMVQLYERHFQASPIARGGWMNNVRYYSAARQLGEQRFDEITLEGPGWKKDRLGAVARGAGNRLKLRFSGTRLDLVLMSGDGGARVLIDGKAPSALHLFHGTRPFTTLSAMVPPGRIIQYSTGPDIRPETWELTFKDISPDGKKFHFKLYGSLAGDDGEGSPSEKFVSRSGRITIEPDDWLLGQDWPPPPGWPQAILVWKIVGDYRDQVQYPAPSNNQFEYLTVADGLAPGEHELTLLPGETGSFSIHAVEAYNPPMAGK